MCHPSKVRTHHLSTWFFFSFSTSDWFILTTSKQWRRDMKGDNKNVDIFAYCWLSVISYMRYRRGWAKIHQSYEKCAFKALRPRRVTCCWVTWPRQHGHLTWDDLEVLSTSGKSFGNVGKTIPGDSWSWGQSAWSTQSCHQSKSRHSKRIHAYKDTFWFVCLLFFWFTSWSVLMSSVWRWSIE